MNFFPTDKSPIVSAKNLCDRHVYSQINEAAQILDSIYCAATEEPEIMKIQGNKKPVIWCFDNGLLNYTKFSWLIDYLRELLRLYDNHTQNYHKYQNNREVLSRCIIYRPEICEELYHNIDFSEMQSFGETTKPENKKFYDYSNNPVKNYREYYRYKSEIMKSFKYTINEKPKWL